MFCPVRDGLCRLLRFLLSAFVAFVFAGFVPIACSFRFAVEAAQHWFMVAANPKVGGLIFIVCSFRCGDFLADFPAQAGPHLRGHHGTGLVWVRLDGT